MKVIYHVGAHATDEDRLVKTLLRNRAAFAKEGIVVPGPSRYRRLIRDSLVALKGRTPDADTQEFLLDAVADEDVISRLLLSFESFFCAHPMVMRGGVFYGDAEHRVAEYRTLFPSESIEIAMGLCNPATFLPAVFNQQDRFSYEEFMQGANPANLRWSELIKRIRHHNPDVSMTVWANEDTPFIWAEIVRELAGLMPMAKITGGFSMLAEIMSPEGMKRFRSYLHQHPPVNEVQKRHIMSAFLGKYAIMDAVEEELDLPGWSDEFVDFLTHQYEEDLLEIERIPGVHMITP